MSERRKDCTVFVKRDHGGERMKPFPITVPRGIMQCAVGLFWRFVCSIPERIVELGEVRSGYYIGGMLSCF